MELEQAKVIAARVVDKLTPCCERIAVAGSIRRQKSWVNDIDILAIPGNQGKLLYILHDMGTMIVGGPKILRYKLKEGIELDLYIANPETWATLLLIRTGSKEHNIKLCSLAKTKGMVLHADGSGLEKCLAGEGTEVDDLTTSKITCDTETSIFEALGLAYVAPERRS
jgi:DNA polymerase/3'-5' exonuclease PolX